MCSSDLFQGLEPEGALTAYRNVWSCSVVVLERVSEMAKAIEGTRATRGRERSEQATATPQQLRGNLGWKATRQQQSEPWSRGRGVEPDRAPPLLVRRPCEARVHRHQRGSSSDHRDLPRLYRLPLPPPCRWTGRGYPQGAGRGRAGRRPPPPVSIRFRLGPLGL